MEVRPQFLRYLQIADFSDTAEEKVIVKEPISGKYFHMSAGDFRLLSLLDGTVTIQEALDRLKTLGYYYSPHDAATIVSRAAHDGLLLGTKFNTAEHLKALKERMDKAKKSQMFSRVFFLFIPLINPDRFLNNTLWLFRLLCNRLTAALVILAVPGAIYLLVAGIPRIERQFSFFFNFENILYLWGVIALTKLSHEFAHAYTAKKYGLYVPRMGVAFLIFFPCLFCDTTEAWELGQRRQRMAIAAAGIVAEAVLFIVSTYVWYFSKPGMLNSLAFYLMTISFMSTVLFNGNPLMKFDGYFLLIDYLRMPNLQPKSFGYVKYLFKNRVLGMTSVPSTAANRKEQGLFTLYGIGAFIYRIFLYTGIAMTVYYKFDKSIGIVLALTALALFVIRPILFGAKGLYNQRGSIRPRLGGSIVVLLILLGVGVVLFIPISEKSLYPCYLVASERQKITVPQDTRISDVRIREGMSVSKGTLLLTLDIAYLEMLLEQKEGEREVLGKEIELLWLDEDDEKRASTGARQLQVYQLQDEIALIRSDMEAAQAGIVAPFDGAVTFLDERVQEGFKPGKGEIIGEIETTGDTSVRALIPEPDLHKVTKGNAVTVWFPVDGGRTFAGVIKDVRKYGEKNIGDSPFSSRVGGEIAIEVKGQGTTDEPLEGQYLCVVRLASNPGGIPLGMAGRLIVPTPPRSIAENLLDKMIRTFNRESLF